MFPWYAAEVEMEKVSRPQDHSSVAFQHWGPKRSYYQEWKL